MKHIIQIILCILILSVAHKTKAQQVQYAREIINTLASDAYKGRGYVHNGDKMAADYIAKRFKCDSLIPLYGKSYFQPYDLSVNIFPGNMKVFLNNDLLVPGQDYLVDASSPSIKGKFKIVSVTAQEIDTNDKLLELNSRSKGKFVLLDTRVKDSNTDPNTINKIIESLKYDPGFDFKGLIIITNDKLTWTTEPFQSLRPVITVNKKDLNVAEINIIEVNIEADFIKKYTTQNVVGLVKGTSISDSMIVITAHYDHLGEMGKGVIFHGANDNASGTAMLLCFAKYYATHRPKYNTVLIAFSGEEIGLLGSKAFVDNPLIDLKKIKFLVNFDLAGTGDEGIKVVDGTIYKKQFDILDSLNKEYNLLSKVEIRGEACISDHCRFYAKGVPSFFIYTLGGIAAYHDIYDRAETLPLTNFQNYFDLMVKFFDAL
ncbi:MAG: M28 family peptidase [Ginsengibacter sp.]